jgi:poly-gamma-glutamate capsule biosynthesis protein CapA/YwtB (metallophosphatase superfamily)
MSKCASQEIKLLFAGDLVVSNELSMDPFFDSKNFISLFNEYDYKILNFEAPIIDNNCKPAAKIGPSLFQKKGWQFFFSENRFNIASIANNHIMDYGKKGLELSINELKKLNVITLGASLEADSIYKPVIISKNNIKIALFTACESNFGVFHDGISNFGTTGLCSPKLKEAIKLEKEVVDFIILFTHCGLEMEFIPLPEWREIFRQFINSGVDIIINSHPHVIQGKEFFLQKPIYYSLGNFFFNQPLQKQPQWNQSLLVGVSLKKEGIIETKEYFVESNLNSVEISYANHIAERFLERSLILLNENQAQYYNMINLICLEHWQKYLYKYFSFAPFKEKHYNFPNIIQKFINAFRYLFYSKEYFTKQNELWLYHNMGIESNFFTIKRSLQLILDRNQ